MKDEPVFVAVIRPDGTVDVVTGPGMLSWGTPAATRRASHVVPAAWPWTLVFKALRCFGDRGPLAFLSRLLPGPWQADMRPVGGPLLPVSPSRDAAIQAERDYLVSNPF